MRDAIRLLPLWVLLAAMLTPAFLSPALAGEALDLSSSADSLKAARKLWCSLEENAPVTFGWQGSVFARIPGQRDKLLFKYEAYNVRACAKISDPKKGEGFKLVSREILFYTDPKTGQIVDSWDNPFTGETVDVVHVANDPVNQNMYANGRWGPFRLGATFQENQGYLRLEVPLFYTNPLGGEYQDFVGGAYHAMEIFYFFFPKGPLFDPETVGVDEVGVAWTRISPWVPWMKMGDRMGLMVYTGAGVKIGSWDKLPAMVKEKVMAEYPDFRTPPPMDDKRPNDTSWTVFKRHIDQKRATEPAAPSGHGH